jgi:hypothetical protein
VYTQDLGLAHYGAVRLNEYYTSQYIDYTPGAESLVPLTREYENAFVAHTMSKAYGLAGMRFGYVIAQPPGKRLQRIALLSGGEKAMMSPDTISRPDSLRSLA